MFTNRFFLPAIFCRLVILRFQEPHPCLSVAERQDNGPSMPLLDWQTRKHIALGSARGLSYLHENCEQKIIHRDVKAANILLDKNFEAVVGDFGMAKLMNYKDTHVITSFCGTLGYVAPEYISTGKSSEKTDVYGYGVMLLELITGKNAFDLARFARDEDVLLLEWVRNLFFSFSSYNGYIEMLQFHKHNETNI